VPVTIARRCTAGVVSVGVAAALVAATPALASSLGPGLPSPSRGLLSGVDAVSETDVWAVGVLVADTGGDTALVEHWDGQTLTKVPSPTPGVSSSLSAVSGVSATDVWAVGRYDTAAGSNKTLVEHWDGTRWSKVPSPGAGPRLSTSLVAVSAVSTTDAWAVGSRISPLETFRPLIEHWDGTRWSKVPSPQVGPSNSVVLSDVSAVSATDAWAVGERFSPLGRVSAVVEHWDGTRWTKMAIPHPGRVNDSDLRGVSAVSTTDAWAVGRSRNNALIIHWDGTSWTKVPAPRPGPINNNYLFDVSAVSATDAWAVGSRPINISSELEQHALIEHWDGTRWTKVPNPSPGQPNTNELFAVSADSPTDAWAVGFRSSVFPDIGPAKSLLEHWDGTSWATFP
jgi:hypothetical protein